MLSLRLAGVSLALLACTACGSSYSSPTPTPSPTPDPTPGGPTSAVTIQAGAEALGTRAYSPPDLNVAVGTVVTWTNSDSVDHTTDSDGAVWRSGVIRARGTFAVTFGIAGTFPYHCSIHPGMVGRVIVK